MTLPDMMQCKNLHLLPKSRPVDIQRDFIVRRKSEHLLM